MSLKIYYWDSLETLGQYQCGEAFALADSKEQAVKLIMKEFEAPGYRSQKDIQELKTELESGTPTVYDSPKGFCIWGSA